MVKEYFELLNSEFKGEYRAATETEIQELIELGKNKLPDYFIETYKKIMPLNEIVWDDFKIYSIEDIKIENKDAVPGCNLYPMGLFTFASTFDGDAVCIDLNDLSFPIYQCSHELLCDETEICFYKDGMQYYEYTYENVIRISMKLAENYEEFLKSWVASVQESYSVTEMIESF